MTIVAAVFVDMFNAEQRGPATTIFSINVLMAPMIAPFIGGFIVGSPLGWRWTAWLGAIMGFTALTIVLFLLEETYAPKILESKAQVLRRTTGNWALHSVSEEATLDMRQLLTEYLSRPLRLLFTEPLVFLVSIYLAFIYGLVYLFLTAYPLVFSGVHGMKPGVSGLPYLAMVIGMLIAATYLLLIQPSFKRKMTANHNKVVPEWRLPPAIIGSCTFAAGILMLGWTGYRSNIHWIFPTLSGLLTGFGVMAIFQQLLNYLFDTYFPVAASVNAGASVIRSLFGACFPLFASQMFASLGINYACTVLSGIAALCIPIPVAFYFWGPKLRARAKLGISPKI
jgi:DHA1 family multidrug resistance protein-like MFS transporter